jgi:hypothetical protein
MQMFFNGSIDIFIDFHFFPTNIARDSFPAGQQQFDGV